MLRGFRFAATLSFALLVAGAFAVPVFAQTAALPTAPGADRAMQNGGAMAPASLPQVRGASPLEPYLVTWLLPVAGILVAIVCVGVDRRVRS